MPKDGRQNGTPSAVEPSRMEKSVEMAAQGLTIGTAIRQDEMRAALLIRTEVKYCATTFCAAPNTESATIDECAATILAHYSHFNVAEIREAFRMASVGEIEVNMNAYYGLFSVRVIGEIMSAYNDYRTQAARQVRARMQAQQDAIENEQRAEILREKFGTLEEQFAALKERNDKYRRWQDLPGWFCERVVRDDVAGFSLDEKGKAWIIAKQWSANQLANWIMDPQTPKADRSRYVEVEQAYKENPDVFPEGLKKEAQAAYCKMLVFDRIAKYTNP